jgi:DNA-binding NarL/FixJ family response regulator
MRTLSRAEHRIHSATRILIADDHAVVREGLRAILNSHAGWTVCAEATTGRQAVIEASELRPDVVILDVAMPEMNGLEAARQIRRDLPAVKILILTMYDTEELAKEFAEAGADAYVLKGDTGRALVDVLDAILGGRTARVDRVHDSIIAAGARHARGSQTVTTSLTRREREVLQLIAEGHSNKEIGNILGISAKTAETHRTRIMTKLNLHSVSELVRHAIRNRIIEA